MFTATNKSSTGSTPLSTAARIIADLPDDRPEVVDKILRIFNDNWRSIYHYMIYIEAIRKIKNAVYDHEGMSLLITRNESGNQKERYCVQCGWISIQLYSSFSPKYYTASFCPHLVPSSAHSIHTLVTQILFTKGLYLIKTNSPFKSPHN